MTNNWELTQEKIKLKFTNKLKDATTTNNGLSAEDLVKTYHDECNGLLGCKHYQRTAKLQANCCGKWFPCRFCHDEVSDHQITRNKTKRMLCMLCETAQPCAKYCGNAECGQQISKYYCETCKLWDNCPKKDIYRNFLLIQIATIVGFAGWEKDSGRTISIARNATFAWQSL
jgi:uncharacterized CHY-type Zn-finger protein